MSNPVVKEMLAVVNNFEIEHYGTPRHSGRYPYGSGMNPYQHSGDFIATYKKLEEQNVTYTDPKTGKVWTGQKAIANAMNIRDEYGEPSTGRLRTQLAVAKNEERRLKVDTAKRLRDKEGMTLTQIADKIGLPNESSVRSLLNENSEARMNEAYETKEFLKKMVDEHGMIDVGAGQEKNILNGVSRDRLNQALYMLELEGYPHYGGGLPQVTNKGRQTNIKVLCPPGTEHREIYDYSKVSNPLVEYVTQDDGKTFRPKFQYPKSMDSNRIKVRYAEEGGLQKDGLVEIRRGVEDLSLGGSHYAQVRILVDNTHYIKGMAVYSDNMPDGVDVIFNTNKSKGTPLISKDGGKEVLKPIKRDKNGQPLANPFGSLIKKEGGQRTYIDANGKEQLSLINKRSEEGDWGNWKDKLPSQFLAKQNRSLAKKQLGLDIDDKETELAEIKALNNPTIKRKMLIDFADGCDSAAVHLQAAALPRQGHHVILPIPSLSENQIYAPNYHNGEKVALIRYPHGGTFEIPILEVNNKSASAKKTMGTSPIDAVGINSKVAERLSGADFDGDTVMVVPCNSRRSSVKITSTDPLKGLEGFDPKLEYGGKEEGTFKVMKNTQNEMGRVSNLITDMTLHGAKDEEMAKVVKHSMVVIDAEKHKLDYKQSEKDNDIAYLKKKYQGYVDEEGNEHGGASTLISRAKGEKDVIRRKGSSKIDPESGRLIWKEDPNATYVNKKGKLVTKTQKSTQMAETTDAYTLSSGHPMESIYADYANKMKAMANEARKESLTTGKLEYNANANKVYKQEVDHLLAELNIAESNSPRERKAQLLANTELDSIKQDNPDLTTKEIKKLSQQILDEKRDLVGATRHKISISDREWEAIQSGAISDTRLTKIMKYADPDDLKSRATPRSNKTLSNAKLSRISSMKALGYTNVEIANALGVSTSTVSKYLK